mmetsp:Transcript_32756/g.79293  ORF Transcript_32756/g.79293 Transcript_32756/m.79293 type:complete len:870 (-) Transcript_32756:471-3080(-)|eukprot:CAMPEP_0181103952 /NCGR_PEP_ID=MMETSP1071-20121207/15158_1 /TAXON_ID=35127 /ORGANISM="Thalassiosira sp., Strain NH16" /LENGTH=869 /DNA_ID=CAMNT_0023187097 /DNA_START=178 /DNA_END=2787 /DNA_ORIENTATION=+
MPIRPKKVKKTKAKISGGSSSKSFLLRLPSFLGSLSLYSVRSDTSNCGGGLVGAAAAASNCTTQHKLHHGVNNSGRWSIPGSATAFVTPAQSAAPEGTTSSPIRADTHSSPLLPMKRPPAAFTSSIKRSFGLGTAGLNMSSSSATKGTESSSTNNNNKPTTGPPLSKFRSSLSHSWLQQLSPEDPLNAEKSISAHVGSRGRDGRAASAQRPVFNGHYVLVRPTPLKNPKLVVHSPELTAELGFAEGEVRSGPFVRYFSGDVDGAFADIDDRAQGVASEGGAYEGTVETWATPYALSIMGKRYTNNCPYGTGDGYGDGRAISVGEILVPREDGDATTTAGTASSYPHAASRYELQLKGAGQTPFCRGADGRAVLRSSIREFLASEAMHHLGVSTTRALSLVVSDSPGGDTSNRPWYSDNSKSRELPGMDDPRLARYDERQKREILSQLAAQSKSDPDMMVEERCAITTRVAPSFVRIGHLDLFARRVEMLAMKDDGGEKEPIKETSRYQELEDMMWHAAYREFYETAYAPYFDKKDSKAASLAVLDGAMNNIARMVGGWIRVGFVQGNFNADNCLVGGRTMDYGPFGFLDVYHPLMAKWTGSGDHFGFMNQPQAGYANFAVLVESLLPIIDANDGDVDEVRDEVLKKAQTVFSEAVDVAMRSKMGLDSDALSEGLGEQADELWSEIEPLLKHARGDWTMFWRQLTYVAAKYSPVKKLEDGGVYTASDYDAMMTMLLGEGSTNPFYDALTDENRSTLRTWIENWHKLLTECYNHSLDQSKDGVIAAPEETMRLANPKYTLREWMLVDAYTKADAGKSPGNPFSVAGDYTGVHELFELCKDPYGEGSAELHKKYYRRAPDESLRAGGTAFMS